MSLPSLRTAVRHLATIIGALLLVLGLGGCSTVQFAYNNAPQLASWWLDGYVDLDDAQRQAVREDLARLHAWHRAEELPRWAQLLKQAERLAASDFTAAQLCALEPLARERLAAVADRVEAPFTQQALSMKPAQLRQLEAKFAAKEKDYLDDWVNVPAEEQRAKRLKSLQERSETVYGKLNERQLALLREHVRDSVWTPRVTLAERQRRHADTLAVLRQVAGSDAGIEPARQAIRGLLARYQVPPDPRTRATLEAYKQEGCTLSAALQAAATPAQREHAVRRLRAWQKDLAELSAGR